MHLICLQSVCSTAVSWWKSMFNKLIYIGTICIPMQPPEGLNIRYEINSSSRAWWNIFIDLSIQSETPPAVYFLSDHLQEQEGDVYSHGDAWDGRVMAPCHAPSLRSSDFVSLHVWPHCWLGWEHSHSRLGFSTAAPRLSVGCWSCAGNCEGGGVVWDTL